MIMYFDLTHLMISFEMVFYSPSGKLVQIEHALTAVGSGQTSLGIKGNFRMPVLCTIQLAIEFYLLSFSLFVSYLIN